MTLLKSDYSKSNNFRVTFLESYEKEKFKRRTDTNLPCGK